MSEAILKNMFQGEGKGEKVCTSHSHCFLFVLHAVYTYLCFASRPIEAAGKDGGYNPVYIRPARYRYCCTADFPGIDHTE
jgi:hypothetical protein